MKKLLIITNIFTLILFYFGACKKDKCVENTDTICSNYSTTAFKGLSKKFVTDGIKAYKNGLNPATDARSAWFNLDVLKKFIWLVETQSLKNGITDTRKLGIRIYYTRYPTVDSFSYYTDLARTPKEYARMHTTIMIPTYYNVAQSANVDFDPRQMKSFGVPLPLNAFFSNNKIANSGNTVARAVMADEITALNHADLIPPMSGGNYAGADLMSYADTH